MKLKILPKTSVRTYISGLHSLNLDLKDGTGFDWHFSNYWLEGNTPIKLYGEGQETNTNGIYGYYGVSNRDWILQNFGLNVKTIYMADHHRAILDLVYESLSKYKMIGYAKGCVSDYFFDNNHAHELFAQLVRMLSHMEGERREILYGWLSREFRSFYKLWKSGRLQVGTLAGYGADTLQD
jgi:hypothetical protein